MEDGLQVLWHTVVTHGQDGVVHVQKCGPEHIVEGSERIIDLLPGEVAIVRHLAD